MYCKKCGAELPEGMNFCTKCGTPVTKATATPARDGKTTALNDNPSPAPAVQKQPARQQPPQQPPAAMQPESQMPTPTPPVQQESAKEVKSPKKGGAVAYIALVASIAALVLAIVTGFVLPSTSPSSQSANVPKVVDAGKTTITIKAGEQNGRVKILSENSPYIVVATSMGSDYTFSDVMFDTGSGDLCLNATKKVEKDTERIIMWVAYEK